jgi:branched-chain amino acid transport system substrate-binding protein
MSTAPAPIRIGYCLSLTGPVAGNTRSARLAHDIWREDVNGRGGLLGRPVELVCYDDQADASRIPDLYKRLMDEDKVDLIIGGYGTNTVLSAMPLIMERQRFLVGLMGLGVNNALAYPGYFAMIPTGPDPNAALTEGFFALAAKQKPRPTTVALVSADAEFSRNPILGAKTNSEEYGFRVVHEATYALTTQDFTPVIDSVAESGCDLLFLCSYLEDSIGLVRAIHAHPFRPKMVGASMIGPQNTAVKTTLGPLLNGFVNYEYWAPVPKMMFPGVQEFLNTYRPEPAPPASTPWDITWHPWLMLRCRSSSRLSKPQAALMTPSSQPSRGMRPSTLSWAMSNSARTGNGYIRASCRFSFAA